MKDESRPRLKHAAIAYPLDSVTFGQMRRREPLLFDHVVMENKGRIEVIATHVFEQVLAEKTFARHLALPDPYPRFDRSEILSALNDSYKEYGISTGMQQTRQLARDIEAAAARQAEPFTGKSR
ncbi:MAG: hypothetical protein HRU75_05725 [Planctomycetia bacterium]|nr:MAG: hypothetical protein HRU75_05725 [Planctomycetia bacterium]